MLLKDFELRYTAWHRHKNLPEEMQPHCRVRIWDLVNQAHLKEEQQNPQALLVVQLSQPTDDYSGLSITNGCEYAVAALFARNLYPHIHHPMKRCIFIEHYPDDGGHSHLIPRPSYDLIRFKWSRGQPYGPKWSHLGREGFEELIGCLAPD